MARLVGGRAVCVALALILPLLSSAPLAIAQEDHIPLKLLGGGKIYCKNDLQAVQDSMLIFRKFRGLMRKLEPFEEVKSEEEAELVVVLSSDPDLITDYRNPGIALPSGYGTSRPMILLIYDPETEELLYFDAVPWMTRAATGQRTSYQELVDRLKVKMGL